VKGGKKISTSYGVMYVLCMSSPIGDADDFMASSIPYK